MHASYRPINWLPWLPKDLYRVDDDGIVWRWYLGNPGWLKRYPPRWKALKPRGKRRDMITLHHQKKKVTYTIASLVLRAFVGPRPIGCQAFHYPDADCRNNRLVNLRWAPKGAYHALISGEMPAGNRGNGFKRGDANFRAVLQEEDIPLIFQYYREGWTIYDIADELEVGYGSVWGVLTGKSWSHVECDRTWPERLPDNKGSRHGHATLGEDDVRRIVRMAGDGATRAAIAREFDVTTSVIGGILTGKTWTHVTKGLQISEPAKGPVLRFGKSEISRIFLMTAEGKSRSEIARDLGCSSDSITDILTGRYYRRISQELGATYATRGKPVIKINAGDVAMIFHLSRSGKTQAEIARELGVSRSSICKILKGKRHVSKCPSPPVPDRAM